MPRIKIKEILKAAVNKITSSNEMRASEREKICKPCPSNAGGICSECGCLISLKIYSEEKNCPLNKWKD